MKKSNQSNPPAAAGKSRAARRVHATLPKSKAKPASGRSTAPGVSAGDDPALVQSTLSAPAEGAIRLEVSTMSPQAVFALLTNVDDGLVTTDWYPTFPVAIKSAITANKEAVLGAINNLANGEAWVRTLRATLEIEVNNGRNTLRTAAAACESIDRRDEALLSVGWELRRPAGRPRPVVAPAQLRLKNTAFEGAAEARWTRVPNVQFYEVKAWDSPTSDQQDTIPWDTLPVIPVRPASLVLADRPVGSYLTVRVRAVGAKGPSPWTENATVRIY